MNFEGIWVVDFGGQYNQLIARRVREANVYAEIVPYEKAMARIESARGAASVGGGAAGSRLDGVAVDADAVSADGGARSVTSDVENQSNVAAAQLPAGIIFTGGPNSVYEDDTPTLPASFFSLGIPVLGICYGAQLMAHVLGGKVVSPDFPVDSTPAKAGESSRRAYQPFANANGVRPLKEYGRVELAVGATDSVSGVPSKLFAGIEGTQVCWMSHTDYIEQVPDGFIVTSHTDNCPTASMENHERGLYAVQFHPEVHHTPFGQELLKNFLYKVCGCRGDWTMANFAKQKISEIRDTVGDSKVLCALSGGVDSSVAAVLVHQAIGDNLTCIFVDHGLLRKDEGDQVMEVYGQQFNMKIHRVNATERFLSKLADVTEPERKRKIIGAEFIAVFEEESAKLREKEGGIDFLLQGTIYPDVVESGGGGGGAAVIKSHHNVGGLPEDMNLTLLEPLRLLFKDEVRGVGEELGIAPELVWRQPFPGPGLAIRCLGAVSEEKLLIIRESDAILREEIDAYNEALFAKTGERNYGASAGDDKNEVAVWQYFTVLPDIRSVGVMGDARTYDYAVGIRAVCSVDGMTSDWARLPYDLLERISNRIVNEVDGVNRVLYDLTSKPPGTIEWE